MPTFKPAYLIHGDDHGRIGERRSRLRTLAEAESGAGGIEVLEGDDAVPDAVARALNTMTFAIGRRFIVVDDAERWKDKELDALEAALAIMPGDTTVAFFAREDSRLKAPARLHAAVRKAGGDIAPEQNVKPWELPRWVAARAAELGLRLDPDAARTLVQNVGERQQRLLRELEKLALGTEAGATLDVTAVEELTVRSAERKSWSLADAMLGAEAAPAVRLYLELRSQGERVPGLLYWITQRVRKALEVAQAIAAGESTASIKRRLRLPSRAADRLIADARDAGTERLQRALGQLADLELASRGGGSGVAAEDTSMLLAITRIAA